MCHLIKKEEEKILLDLIFLLSQRPIFLLPLQQTSVSYLYSLPSLPLLCAFLNPLPSDSVLIIPSQELITVDPPRLPFHCQLLCLLVYISPTFKKIDNCIVFAILPSIGSWDLHCLVTFCTFGCCFYGS